MLRLSRSQIECRQKCPTQEYWTYRYGGLGLQRTEHALPLVAGIHTHEVIALVLQGRSIDDALAQVVPAYQATLTDTGVVGIDADQLDHLAAEQACLLEGLTRGWVRYRLPLLLDEYDVVSVEQEDEWPLDGANEGLTLQVRMDAVLRHKDTRALHVLDLKTVSYPSARWQAAFDHSLQTILYTAALEHAYPKDEVAGVFYEGLCTGGRRQQESGRWVGRKLQQSPLCYGYSNGTEYQLTYTNKKGWAKTAAWEMMPPAQWAETVVGDVEWAGLYWHVPTIRPTLVELQSELEQLLREELIHQERLASLPVVGGPEHWLQVQVALPKHRTQCLPWDGAKCPCYELCYERAVGEAPILSGVYRPRDPHHPQGPAEAAPAIAA